MTSKETIEQYMIGHRASNIHVGDKVLLFKQLPEDEEWGDGTCCWILDKNALVGKIFEISKDEGSKGFILKNEIAWHYPYYVFQKIEPLAPIEKYQFEIADQILNLPQCIIDRIKYDH